MDTNEINQKLDAMEECLKKRIELTKGQHEELRKMQPSIEDTSQESHLIKERIALIRGWNLRVRTVNYIGGLEKQYDEQEKEFLSSDTTPERRAELVEESKKTSEALQILER